MASKFLSAFVIALILLPGVCAAQTGLAGSPVGSLRVGDAVRIGVYPLSLYAELTGEFTIAEDGTIVHPVYRSIRAAGIPIGQVESQVRELLKRFESAPEFVVEPLFRVSVAGEVRNPNIYVLPPYATVAEAIMGAGGPSEVAQLKSVRLIRDGTETSVDLTKPQNDVSAIRIRSGDQIIVEARRSLWTDTIAPVLSTVSSVGSMIYLGVRVSDALSR